MSRLLALLVVAGVLTACTGDEEPTVAELLEEVEGRELSESELADRQRTGLRLCALEDAVLVELWSRLDEDELAFTDVVFSRQCPERLPLYAEATERFETAG